MKLAKMLFGPTLSVVVFTLAVQCNSLAIAGDRAAVIDASKYPSLQAAFDAVPEAGGLVKLPPGDFKLKEPLVLTRGNTRVEGSGTATKLINCNTQGQPALIIRPANLAKNPNARIWRVQLADFRICGDPEAIDAKSTKPKSGDGVLAENIGEIYLHGMSIDHNGGHGINLVRCSEDARICDSIITYNAEAGVMARGVHDLVLSANQFEENQDAVRFFDSVNLCMNGNNIDDHLRHGVVMERCYGSVLSGNMIEECRGTGVVLDRNCYGITISANVIAHNNGGGIDLRDAWGCSISANTFTVNAGHALIIGPKSGRIAVTGNSISNDFSGPGEKLLHNTPTKGVLLEGTTDIAISGNTFTGLVGQAVQANQKCRRIAITGNVATDLNRGSSKTLPAWDIRGAKQCVIDNNIIDKADTTANR